MPVLNIGGQRVRVGDEFLSLSPDMQNETVDEIARSLPGSSAIEAPTASANGTSGPWERYQAQAPAQSMFAITAPDGAKYRVQGPNAEGAVAALQQHRGETSQQSAPMQTFEILDKDGSRYEVQAPDERSAVAGFQQYRGGAAPGGAQTPSPIQVEGPDGAIIEFPHGTSQDVMEGALRKHYGGPSHAAGASSDLPPGFVLESAGGPDQERVRRLETALINADKAGDTDAAKTLAAEIQRARQSGADGDGPWNRYRDVGMATAAGRGAAQGLTLGGYDELRGVAEAGGIKPNEPMSLGSLIRGGYNLMTGTGNPEYEAGKNRVAAELKTAQQQHPMTTGAGEIGGALTGGLMLAPLSLTGNAARLGMGLRGATLGSVGDGAILGGIHGALNADEGKRWEEAKSGAKFGAGVGLVAPLAISGVSNAFRRAVTPMTISPERQAAADVLRNEGVGLSAGQTTGSKNLRYAEGEIGGRAAENLMERQGEQFTRAALSRAGINADRATPEVIDNAFTRIGQQFDDLAARNSIVPDQRLVSDLQGVVSEYTSLVPDAMRAPVVRNVAQDVVDAIRRGSISGESYQALRSRLERSARTSRADPQLSDALRGMREALDDAMQRTLVRTNPQDLGHWQQARREYRNMLVIEKAASGAGENAALGIISPSALRNATVQQSRRAYARGQGDFAELARSGEALMKPMPQSGTAPRQAVRNLGAFVPMALGGSAGYAAGSPQMAIAGMLMGAAVPRAVGAAMMSRPGQAYLTNQVLPGNISPATRAIANALLGNGILTARDRR